MARACGSAATSIAATGQEPVHDSTCRRSRTHQLTGVPADALRGLRGCGLEGSVTSQQVATGCAMVLMVGASTVKAPTVCVLGLHTTPAGGDALFGFVDATMLDTVHTVWPLADSLMTAVMPAAGAVGVPATTGHLTCTANVLSRAYSATHVTAWPAASATWLPPPVSVSSVGEGCALSRLQLHEDTSPVTAGADSVCAPALMLPLQTPPSGWEGVTDPPTCVLLVQSTPAAPGSLSAVMLGTTPLKPAGILNSSASRGAGGAAGVSVTVAVSLAPEGSCAVYWKVTGPAFTAGKG